MAQGDDVTLGPALAGRLLRALGRPLQRGSHHNHYGVSASGSDAIALELVAWPSSPAPTEPTTPISTSTPTTTDGNTAYDFDSRDCHSPQTIKRRPYSQSLLDSSQGHRRANSLDSTTTDSSTASTSSSSSSRSRWETFGQYELTTAYRNPKHVEDRRSRQSREVWREYW
ncbi:uncharacterized protein ColSpa_06250 [Colletotrichum spaethianum]|uniref:Uncharacterized protein n=1 Tax=Colletotrichum spaethianum TaxID=700344 RepID=A0AA37P7W7_9PEZI|nr:uncharacterized protein ColSpa_06250 [Colletotrichum spaethianum]GKT46069.1 hypothetical protein ColSpa_06250 [Colletotrichum spaethianum]